MIEEYVTLEQNISGSVALMEDIHCVQGLGVKLGSLVKGDVRRGIIWTMITVYNIEGCYWRKSERRERGM